jgi:hypothetical protein
LFAEEVTLKSLLASSTIIVGLPGLLTVQPNIDTTYGQLDVGLVTHPDEISNETSPEFTA